MDSGASNHLLDLLGGLSAKAAGYRRVVFPVSIHEF
jgi:hypothetical protein